MIGSHRQRRHRVIIPSFVSCHAVYVVFPDRSKRTHAMWYIYIQRTLVLRRNGICEAAVFPVHACCASTSNAPKDRYRALGYRVVDQVASTRRKRTHLAIRRDLVALHHALPKRGAGHKGELPRTPHPPPPPQPTNLGIDSPQAKLLTGFKKGRGAGGSKNSGW